ncbi:hypothetical protein CYMTET_56726 [Cymbomonas tetramitiformis]|uniref:2Fe-2S ferredoxin-type domain-containing protein n=1 Tax=Cymbomonas tetramitiformis TaxID=36881 RepID=A0AAE0BBL4_9CHLO|nr:hypothetical protein CYMTET_56726 [Cymbomonas tetramitiformis]
MILAQTLRRFAQAARPAQSAYEKIAVSHGSLSGFFGQVSQVGVQRNFTGSSLLQHKHLDTSGESIEVVFIEGGVERTVRAPLGTSLMEVAHANDIELEGACEGSLACSTCHVVVEDPAVYDLLPEPCDDENDMLDSRLASRRRLGWVAKSSQQKSSTGCE